MWTVDFERNSTDAGTGIDDQRRRRRHRRRRITTSGAATVANTAGGVFQVGANVTATNQIQVSIDDVRITSGTNTHLHRAGEHRRHRHRRTNTHLGEPRRRRPSLRCRRFVVKLGADQNRFQSTIANLQVTTENLSASESRIRDTDMASEMVNFTHDQILLQAGTAMLAQANSAPQTILRLLQ